MLCQSRGTKRHCTPPPPGCISRAHTLPRCPPPLSAGRWSRTSPLGLPARDVRGTHSSAARPGPRSMALPGWGGGGVGWSLRPGPARRDRGEEVIRVRGGGQGAPWGRGGVAVLGVLALDGGRPLPDLHPLGPRGQGEGSRIHTGGTGGPQPVSRRLADALGNARSLPVIQRISYIQYTDPWPPRGGSPSFAPPPPPAPWARRRTV